MREARHHARLLLAAMIGRVCGYSSTYSTYKNNNMNLQNQYNNYQQGYGGYGYGGQSGGYYNSGGYNNYNRYQNNAYRGNQNGYNYMNSGGAYGAYDQYGNRPMLSVCDNSVVSVTSIQVICDSPYTFYYGNGANRNSATCDYGDKATLSISFNVADDIDEVNDYYMTMAIYDPGKNILVATEPEYLCNDYVGYDCTSAGTYKFQTKLKFSIPNGEYSHFYPLVRLAFSTKADSGYNLGAANIECRNWNGKNNGQTSAVAWSTHNDSRNPTKEFLVEYAMLILTSISILGLAVYVYIKSRIPGQVDEVTEGFSL